MRICSTAHKIKSCTIRQEEWKVDSKLSMCSHFAFDEIAAWHSFSVEINKKENSCLGNSLTEENIQKTRESKVPPSPTFLKTILSFKSEFISQIHTLFLEGFELRTELNYLKILTHAYLCEICLKQEAIFVRYCIGNDFFPYIIRERRSFIMRMIILQWNLKKK